MTARLQRALDLIAERGAEHVDVDDLAVVSLADEIPDDVDIALPAHDDLGLQLALPLAQRPDQKAGLLIIAELAGALHDEAGNSFEHLLLDDSPDLLLGVFPPLA